MESCQTVFVLTATESTEKGPEKGAHAETWGWEEKASNCTPGSVCIAELDTGSCAKRFERGLEWCGVFAFKRTWLPH